MTRIQSPEMDEGGKKKSALSRGAENEIIKLIKKHIF